MTTNWQPKWWNEVNASGWDRVREALRRDWEQTKHDLGLAGGHELNQTAEDTLKQAARTEPIPPNDLPNPPKVVGRWDEAEFPIGYGFGAYQKYGVEHPKWNEHIESTLRAEWIEGQNESAWNGSKSLIRYGYEYRPKP